MASNYLICYLGASNSLTLRASVSAASMGEAMSIAADLKRDAEHPMRWFVLHGYEIDSDNELEKTNEQ